MKNRTVLIQKDSAKGNAVGNYRPIVCLNLLWKHKTGAIADKLFQHLENKNLLLEEQKGSRHVSRDTKDQFLIDKAVIRNRRRRKVDINMAWFDFRKAYDMVPHAWKIKALKLIGAALNVIALLKSSMIDWKTELISGGINLGQVNNNRGIFLGDSLSPLLFVISLIPVTLVLRQVKQGYYHLLFMDDLKLYESNQNELDSLVRTIDIMTKDIGMKFGIDKCGVLATKRGKEAEYNGIELENGEEIGPVGEERHKYLNILEKGNMCHKEMKGNIRKDTLRG